MKHRPTKIKYQTPPAVYQEVCLRAGGEWVDGEFTGGHCIGGSCEMVGHTQGDWRDRAYGLCFAHLKHRKMGGTTNPEIHNAENIRRSCWVCHDSFDHRSAK